MITVGITGNLGSGKSTVCRVFSMLGIPVFNSDEQARIIMNTDPHVRQKLTKLFGDDVYMNNQLNRKLISDIIFNNKNSLKKINSVVHPAVRNTFNQWRTSHRNFPYIINEAAILVESGGNKDVDKLILVTAPEKLRIERVIKRDKRSVNEIKNITNNQLPDDKKVSFADFIIENNDKKLILPTIIEIHNKLIKL